MNQPRDIPAWALWLMRLLALAALILSMFLLFLHLGEAIALSSRGLPFCSWASWLDCSTVLSSPRYSKWFGVPVSAPAVVLYLVVTAGLFVKRRPWFVLDAAAVMIAAAAVWFVYVQTAVLHKVCIYCLTDHAIGLLLAFLIWLHGPRETGRWAAGGLGAVMAAVLVVGQVVHQPTYAGAIILGSTDGQGRFVEEGPGDQAVPLGHGQVVLNRAAHPQLGLPGSKYAIVEFIDYTCPRCQNLTMLYRQATKKLGPDYSVVVLTVPLSHDCNTTFLVTEERHKYACELAALGHALNLADPSRYEEFHDWLFDNQDGMTPDKARAEAQRIVGKVALDAALAKDVAGLIRRDTFIGRTLEVNQLPGLFARDTVIKAIPEDAEVLTLVIRAAFDGKPSGP